MCRRESESCWETFFRTYTNNDRLDFDLDCDGYIESEFSKNDEGENSYEPWEGPEIWKDSNGAFGNDITAIILKSK